MGNKIDIRGKIEKNIRKDNIDQLKILYEKENIEKDIEISKNRTAIVLCALFDSPNCLSYLISRGHDINIPDQSDKNTPLIIASKFGYNKIIDILLQTEMCNTSYQNKDSINALDMAILRGNYTTCVDLMQKAKMRPEKNLENYMFLNYSLKFPLFKIDLFYKCLMENVPIEEAPSFTIENKRRKEFEGKVPDPNETWLQFFKRLYRLELYQPPLVDKEKIEKKNTLFMKMQSRLCEMEYNIKIDLKNDPNKKKEIELKGEKDQQKLTEEEENYKKVERKISSSENQIEPVLTEEILTISKRRENTKEENKDENFFNNNK